MMVRVFANYPGDRGSISGRVIQKTQKWHLMPPCLTPPWISLDCGRQLYLYICIPALMRLSRSFLEIIKMAFGETDPQHHRF